MKLLIIAIVVVAVAMLGCVTGVFIGVERMKDAIKRRTMGALRIDHSEPDEPAKMFIELKGVTPDTIAQDRFVIFEVVNESYLSQE